MKKRPVSDGWLIWMVGWARRAGKNLVLPLMEKERMMEY
jgi:hypothetical protein